MTDLRYGIQHGGTSRHSKGKQAQNPLDVVGESIAGWYQSLKSNGVAVIAFNRYQPKREHLLKLFEKFDWELISLDLSHRKSESILRDVLVFKKP